MSKCEAIDLYHPTDRPEAVQRWEFHCHALNACQSCSDETDLQRRQERDVVCAICGTQFNTRVLRDLGPVGGDGEMTNIWLWTP